VEFWFGEFCAGEMEVTVRKPHELVRWHVTPKAASDWVDTEVELKIFRVDKQTVLHFRHSNWHEDAKMFPHCSLGWAIFLLSLKEFVETGSAEPHFLNAGTTPSCPEVEEDFVSSQVGKVNAGALTREQVEVRCGSAN
jgi:hypothetical protein